MIHELIATFIIVEKILCMNQTSSKAANIGFNIISDVVLYLYVKNFNSIHHIPIIRLQWLFYVTYLSSYFFSFDKMHSHLFIRKGK